ncbi:YybH family protein [Aridibaculum aurantiacum]|uniref:YybH family protein n=1 Tax=Aridibaculum aurantiacum TaxID=2810307 RepID=UPI001A976F5F|nr:nuclear transport factor 2 family protein [Aridibaculum aurantiacum]
MKKLSLLLLICFLQFSSHAQSKDEQAIRNILAEQTTAWNAGDIEGFMKGYWKNDSLLFIGKSGPKYGFDATLQNYRKSYPDAATMGKLTFDILQVKRLSAIYFSVVGKWHLQRTIGDAQGHFTLLVKKIGKEWRIVQDHSS